MSQKKTPTLRFKGYSDEWEQRKFSNVIENLAGGASIRPTDYLEYGLPTIPKGAINATGVADLSGSKYVSEEFFKKNKTSHVSTNNLVTSLRDLVPSAPNMGRIVRIEGKDEQFLMPQGVYKLELLECVDEDFLISFSNSDKYRKNISAEKNGSTQVHIRNREFLNIEIKLPTKHEQKEVGAFFKCMNTLITLHQHKLKILKQLKQAMLQKMFPAKNKKVPELRFKGFLAEWEQRNLGSLGKVLTGNTPPTSDLENWSRDENGYVWITPTDIDRLIISNSERHLTDRGWKTGRTIPENSVLITCIASIGKNAINTVPVAFNQQINAIVPKGNNSYFILSAMERDKVRFASLAGQTATAIINKTVFEKFQIALPKFEEQEKIGLFFSNLDYLITLYQSKLDKLKSLKTAYLQLMFI